MTRSALDQKNNEISGVALDAKRRVYELIDEYYNKSKKIYKAGKSDKFISDVSGMSEKEVERIRLEWFGELADFDPFEICNDKIKILNDRINVQIKDLHKRIEILQEENEILINDLRNEVKQALR